MVDFHANNRQIQKKVNKILLIMGNKKYTIELNRIEEKRG